MRIILLILSVAITMSACNGNAKNGQSNNSTKQSPSFSTGSTGSIAVDRTHDPMPDHPVGLPDSETLIGPKEVGLALEMNPDALILSCGVTNNQRVDSYCFYKWDSHFANSGVIVQISRNPMHTEYADWAVARIETLLRGGEMSVGDAAASKFEPYREVGDGGAWSYQAGKYYWRHKKEYVFMIAYNTDFPEEKQYASATAIAKSIMENFE